MRFAIGAPITLSFRYILAGIPQTGQTVTATVVNALTGATLLSQTPLNEVVAGQYTYSWSSGLTQFTNCRATYTILGKQVDDYFQIVDDEILSRMN